MPIPYLESASQRYGAVVHVWCLMGNHYHLLLETPEGNLSQIMRHINGAYTTYFNAKRSRAGHLFQGRYKAILVDADSYLLELSRYIHLNPLRAGIVPRPEDYPWSSYSSYIGLKEPHSWNRLDFILGCFSGSQGEYKIFVEDKIGADYPSPLDKTAVSTILGDAGFVAKVVDEYLVNQKSNRELPALKGLRKKPDLQLIVDAATNALTGNIRTARNAAIYLCHQYSGAKLKDIGTFFGISESAVTQASRRFQDRVATDKEVWKIIEMVVKKLAMSKV